MIFFVHVSPGGVLELDHPELLSDLLKGPCQLPRAARHRQEEDAPLAAAVCLPVRSRILADCGAHGLRRDGVP